MPVSQHSKGWAIIRPYYPPFFLCLHKQDSCCRTETDTITFLFSTSGCTYINSEHNNCGTMNLQLQWAWTVLGGLKQLSISWQKPTYIQHIFKSLFIYEMSMLLLSWKAITAYKEQCWNSQCKQYKTTIKPKRVYCFILTITHLALSILHQSCQKSLVWNSHAFTSFQNMMGVGVWSPHNI